MKNLVQRLRILLAAAKDGTLPQHVLLLARVTAMLVAMFVTLALGALCAWLARGWVSDLFPAIMTVVSGALYFLALRTGRAYGEIIAAVAVAVFAVMTMLTKGLPWEPKLLCFPMYIGSSFIIAICAESLLKTRQ